MKKVSLVTTLAASTMLAASLLASNLTNKSVSASDTSNTNVVRINYVPGYSIAVWNTANSNRNVTGQLLKHNTNWKLISQTNGLDGYVWYSLGKNQWISSQYTNKPLKVANNGNTDIVRINYVPGYSIAVWNTANSDRSITGQFLKHNTNWKFISQTNGSDGYVWYSLGKNQWISSQYTNKPLKAANNGNTDIVRINYVPGYSIAVWNTANSDRSITGQFLKHNTNWKFISQTNGSDGYVWYSLGKNQWISSQYTNKPLKATNNGNTNNGNTNNGNTNNGNTNNGNTNNGNTNNGNTNNGNTKPDTPKAEEFNQQVVEKLLMEKINNLRTTTYVGEKADGSNREQKKAMGAEFHDPYKTSPELQALASLRNDEAQVKYDHIRPNGDTMTVADYEKLLPNLAKSTGGFNGAGEALLAFPGYGMTNEQSAQLIFDGWTVNDYEHKVVLMDTTSKSQTYGAVSVKRVGAGLMAVFEQVSY